jgi:putative FmdB family regulatory protein
MPVYEFYCTDCHTIFNFLSRRVSTDKLPSCPRCGRPALERQVSVFAISKNLDEPPQGLPDFDDAKIEQAMMALAGDFEKIDEDDPKAMANLMRKLSSMTGMELGEGAEEALNRLEAGEDPEQIESEMGDLFEGDGLFSGKKLKGLRKRYLPPEQDDTLYSLD